MAALEFNSICRLCVQIFEKEKISPIFNNETYDNKISLSERIKYCSSIKVTENDGLPAQICNTCLLKLNESFIFRNQCVLADITLKRLKDFSLNISEIPNLSKVDIENQIISSDNNDYLNKMYSSLEKVKIRRKSKENIDEFDNSKNGRHKKSIHKLKGVSLQKKKALNREPKEYIQKLSNLDIIDAGLFSSAVIQSSEKKKKISSKGSEKILGNNKYDEPAKKPRELKGIKKFVKSHENLEGDVRRQVGAGINNFKIIKEYENKEKISSLSSLEEVMEEFNEKAVKPVIKKKAFKKKLPFSKEKPSSFKCDHCQKVYPSEGGWRYHIHTMHNENYQPFICDLCGQSFKVKKNLEAHKNSVHFHLKHHLCDLCGRGFASKYSLKVHKSWHNDEKNFTCDVCGTKFRTRGKMNTHRSIHGGPKKFMCHICSRDFRWKKDFEIHMRTHTGEKPFKCSHCGKAFASLTNMKKHEKNHMKKAETEKMSEKFDLMMPPNDGKMRRIETLDFGFGSEDVRNRQGSEIADSIQIQNVKLIFPKIVQAGSSATLLCLYDLEGASLYSAQWYRGRFEFFRFIPNENPQIKVFQIPGLYVDALASNEHQVTLRNIPLQISGEFSCEITTDVPRFSTSCVSDNLTVIDFHLSLDISKRQYRFGDIIDANCTLTPKLPSTKLMFHWNAEPISDEYVNHQVLESVLLHLNTSLFDTRQAFPVLVQLRCSAILGEKYFIESKSVSLKLKPFHLGAESRAIKLEVCWYFIFFCVLIKILS